jgi:hypothetical protein
MSQQCGRLFFYLQRALYASFPFETGMDLVLTINQSAVDQAAERAVKEELDSVLVESRPNPNVRPPL